MSSSGPNSAGMGASDDGVGDVAWTNPEYILSANDTPAICTGDNVESQYLFATQFGFAIPVAATITGIKVEVRRSTDGAGGVVSDLIAKLLKDGSPVGTSQHSMSSWGSSYSYETYGGDSDLWETTWTPAEVNASTFGFALQTLFSIAEVEARVDHVRITVSYTGGSVGSTQRTLTGVG